MQMDTKFPTHEEIWQIFKVLLGDAKFTEVRKLTDTQGVYLWEIQTTSFDGSPIEYSYAREGRFPESIADCSRIDRVELDEQGNPIGGTSAARFIDGRWVVL